MKRHGDVEQLLAKGKGAGPESVDGHASRTLRLPDTAGHCSAGLAKVSNFLPDAVAKGVLRDLAAVPESKWNDTSASDDYTHNNIRSGTQ